jgi:hypothetical protein
MEVKSWLAAPSRGDRDCGRKLTGGRHEGDRYYRCLGAGDSR